MMTSVYMYVMSTWFADSWSKCWPMFLKVIFLSFPRHLRAQLELKFNPCHLAHSSFAFQKKAGNFCWQMSLTFCNSIYSCLNGWRWSKCAFVNAKHLCLWQVKNEHWQKSGNDFHYDTRISLSKATEEHHILRCVQITWFPRNVIRNESECSD